MAKYPKIAILAVVAAAFAVSPVSDSHAGLGKLFKQLFEGWVDSAPRRIEDVVIDYGKKQSDDERILSHLGARVVSRVAIEIKKNLEENASKDSEKCPLCKPAADGNLAEINRLLAEGANPNSVNDNGMTALIVSAIEGHVEIARVLLAAGTNVNHANKEGITALMAASLFGYSEIVKVLLDGGADVNTQSRNGNTAMILAAEGNNWEIVRLLAVAEENWEVGRMLEKAGVKE